MKSRKIKFKFISIFKLEYSTAVIDTLAADKPYF